MERRRLRRFTAGLFALSATCVMVLVWLVVADAPQETYNPTVTVLVISLFSGLYMRLGTRRQR